MPATFPSHQGFVAPLWRRWPKLFDMAALTVGAALPDLVDGLIGICRGHFGQGLGHSLLGLAVLGLPLGFFTRRFLCRTARRVPPLKGHGFLAWAVNRGVADLAATDTESPSRVRAGTVLFGLAVGALAHLLADLISHGHFPWLIPWVPKIKIYPDWWYVTWFTIPHPWRPGGRKMGPYRMIWILLSLWGAWLLLAPLVREWRKRKTATSPNGGRPS